MDNAAVGHAHSTHAAHAAHEHELGFLRKYIFSVDHKVIGIQYAVTGLLFLFFGFTLMMIMRYQLAYPGAPIPLIGALLGAANAPGGIMLPEFYNQLGAMHGTIMVFMGVVPLVLSTGAGSEMRAAMGLAVFSGMIGVTFFGIFMTPVFYVLLRRLAGNRPLVQHGRSTMADEEEGVPAAQH